MAQAGSDALLGPSNEIVLVHQEWGIDFGAGMAVVTGDVTMGATPDDAYPQIRLSMLANEVSLRNLEALQSRPATSCSPVAVTPDELDDAWRDAKGHLPLRTSWNGHLVGQPNAGVDMASISRCTLRTWRGRAMCEQAVSSDRASCRIGMRRACTRPLRSNAAGKLLSTGKLSRRSCVSEMGAGSRCWTRGKSISGAIDQKFVGLEH
jgi:hypothetical protein